MELVPEPEVSYPVLTWILVYFWSVPRGVSPRLEWGHARALSSRDGAAVSCSRRVDQGETIKIFKKKRYLLQARHCAEFIELQ